MFGESLIDAQSLVVAYNDRTIVAVDHIDLKVSGGQVLGILGGNGAGKTSTLRTFGGIVPPTEGVLQIAGFDMTTVGGAEQVRQVVGYCPDTGGLIRQATIREHIGVALALRGRVEQWAYALQLVEQFDLTAVLDRETGGFSHGMSRRLSVLLAALTAEKVLILDEPFDGVDPMGVAATETIIRGAAAAGLTVVVSTHLLSLLVQVSDRICVMNRGRLVADDLASAFSGVDGKDRYAHLLTERGREL